MRPAAAALLLAAPGLAFAAACDLEWRLRPRLDAAERHVEASLSFSAGPRTRTALQLPEPWAGSDDFAAQLRGLRAAGRGQRVEEGDEPLVRVVHHRRGERVTLRWTIVSPVPDPDGERPRTHEDLYRTLLGADWFQFFGKAVLVRPRDADDGRPRRLCVVVDGLAPGAVLAGSHGVQRGPRAEWRRRGPLALVTEAVFVGGALELRERAVDGRPVVTAMPAREAGRWAFAPDRFADAVAQVVGTHRRFWGERDAPPFTVVLHANRQPLRRGGGTAVHQAFVMHASPDFTVPGPSFDFLVGHEHLHQWIPARFGPMLREGENDEALRYWFSEGFTNFYTHRLMVAAGLWSLEDHAGQLTRIVQRYLLSPVRDAPNARVLADFFADTAVADLAYQRGELLALRWHGQLRARGHAGLDAVMKSLLLAAPVTQAARPGEPLATDRLLAALRPLLGAGPDEDLERVVRRGELAEIDEGLLGPCFETDPQPLPAWRVRGGGLAEPECAAWFGF